MSVAIVVPESEPAVESSPSPAELHRQFQLAASFANRNAYRLLLLIRQMDACAGHEAYGCKTLAEYLELACGITRIAARERIRVAFALLHLPGIARAFEAGELSYSKVRAVVRVASEATDAEWLEAAKEHTAEELETMVARSTPDDTGRHRVYTRAISRLVTRMVIELPADEMEVLQRALDRIQKESGGQLSLAEALLMLAADSLAGELHSISTADRYTVVVHVGTDGSGWTETANGPAPVKPAVMERLLCDTTIRVAREERDGTFFLSRAQRTIPIVTRRTIELRDGRKCRVPGCQRRHWIDIHHLEEVVNGGRHYRENLMLLCRYHHRLRHEGYLRIERDGQGGFRFTTANGWVIGETPAETEESIRRWEEKLALCALDDEWQGMRKLAELEDHAPHSDPEESASFCGEDSQRFRGIVVGSIGPEIRNDSAESPVACEVAEPAGRIRRWLSPRKKSLTSPSSLGWSSPPTS